MWVNMFEMTEFRRDWVSLLMGFFEGFNEFDSVSAYLIQNEEKRLKADPTAFFASSINDFT